MTLLILLIILTISNVYINWSSKKPSGLISLEEYYLDIRQRFKFWELLQIISVPFIILYNQFIGIVWLIKGLLKGLTWIFRNFIINGIWLLLRLIFYYFILWPWRILRLVFEQIKHSWNFSYYKIGILGLFITLFLIFLGSYMVQLFNAPEFVGYLMSVLSIFPLGWTLAKISAIRYSREHNVDNQNLRLPFYLAIFFGLSIGLFAVDALLIFIGSFTSAAPVISSILSGGSIFISMLLIFNCILVFFSLSAFPQHLLNSKGDFRTLLKEFFNHLLNKWPLYIMGALAAILPAIILSIIPALIISGSVFLTKNLVDGIYDYRIKQNNDQTFDENTFGNISEWLDPNKINNDSMMRIVDKYSLYCKSEQEKEGLSINKKYITSEFNKYSSVIGAIPVIGVVYGSIVYYNTGQKTISIKPAINRDDNSNSKQRVNKIEENVEVTIQDLTSKLRVGLNEGMERVKILENNLENVCVTKNKFTPNTESESYSAVPLPQQKQVDVCEQSRNILRGQIKDQETQNNYFKQKLSSLMFIKSKFDNINDELKENISRRNTMFSLSYFFLGIWICVITAICFGFFVIIFGNLNYAIYHSYEASSTWHITSLFKQANEQDKNQPLLGLLFTGIFLAIISIMILKYGCFGDLNLTKKFKEIFSANASIGFYNTAVNAILIIPEKQNS